MEKEKQKKHFAYNVFEIPGQVMQTRRQNPQAPQNNTQFSDSCLPREALQPQDVTSMQELTDGSEIHRLQCDLAISLLLSWLFMLCDRDALEMLLLEDELNPLLTWDRGHREGKGRKGMIP